jgi:hypothetical protein
MGVTLVALVTALAASAEAVSVVASDRTNRAFLSFSDATGFVTDFDEARSTDAEEVFGPEAAVDVHTEDGTTILARGAQTSYFDAESFTLIGSFYATASAEDEEASGEGFGQSTVDVTFEVVETTPLHLRGVLNSDGGGGASVLVRAFGGEIFNYQHISGNDSFEIDIAHVLEPGTYQIVLHTSGYGQAHGFSPSLGDFYAIADFSSAVAVGDAAISPASITVGPNPARAGTPVLITTGTTAPVRATIHDAVGRRVAALRSDGTGELRWDARDEAGRPLTPGVYFVRIAGREVAAARRVTILR